MVKQCSLRILSVDDHPLFREGIAAVINNQPDMLMVAEARSGGEALRLFHQYRPDVTVMAMRLPDSSGIEAMRAILTDFHEARVILAFTLEGDGDFHRAVEAGACNCILKTMRPSEMVEIIRQAHARETSAPARSQHSCGASGS